MPSARSSAVFLGSLGAAIAVAFRPAVASADIASVQISRDLTPYYAMIGLTVGVVFFAFLVNRFARKKRRAVRRAAILLILHVIATGLSLLLAALRFPIWSHTMETAAELFGVFTGLNIAAIALFSLGLPAIGVEVATIVADLSIGGGYIISFLTVLRRSGFDLTGLIAATTVVTSILALSLQATLGNILGGVALQLDDSIQPGDWVQLENGRQGKVREIRWRHTVIETRDWDTIIVPNASLLGANIIILGKREGEALQHRMWVYFNVDFRHSPGDVMRVVDEALSVAPIEGVAAIPKPSIVCMDFAKDTRDSFACYAVRYWLTDLPRDDPTSSRVRTRIFSALKRAGIPLAVPAAQLFVEQDDVPRRERKKLDESMRKLDALTNLEFLKPLTEAEREEVSTHLRYAPFAAGETITKQGAVAHWLYILTKGTGEVRIATDGADKLVANVKAPGFFGEMGLMTGQPRTATVVAVTDVECYRLDRVAFERILSDRPEIAAEMAHLLATRRVELQVMNKDLDAAAKAKRLEAEKTKILRTIQDFFGLRDEAS